MPPFRSGPVRLPQPPLDASITPSESADLPLQMDGWIDIIAHRGASHDAPENTLSAIELSREQGADWAEIDVILSADGHVVLFHDRKLQRTTNGKGPSHRLTLAEFKALDAGSWKHERYRGEPVPTLEEALFAAKNRIKLYIEIKETQKRERARSAKHLVQAAERWCPINDPMLRMYTEALNAAGRTVTLTREVIRLVRAADMVDQVVLQSLSSYALAIAAVEAPEFRVEKLCWRAGRAPLSPLPTKSMRLGEVLGLDGMNMNVSGMTMAFAQTVREWGKRVAVYTVNRPSTLRHVLRYGVHGVITDRPDLIRDELGLLRTQTATPPPATHA